jgi:hypothetical protein
MPLNPLGIRSDSFTVLRYGPVGGGWVELDVIHTRDISFRPIMDPAGVDLLHWVVRIQVAAVVNPQAVAYTNLTPLPPVDETGAYIQPAPLARGQDTFYFPPETIQSIRQTLMTPRGQLAFMLNGDVLVVAPPIQGANDLPRSLTCSDKTPGIDRGIGLR